MSSESQGVLETAYSKASVEKRFNLNGYTYAAQLWGEADGLPMIALHGWLDNSNSFSVLAPQLEGVQCLAIDMAGHGLSDHRPGLVDFPIWTDISAIYQIANQMGWDSFGLIGHSRGAMSAILAAGVYPDRISHLIQFDSVLAPEVSASNSLQRMRDSLDGLHIKHLRKPTMYATLEEAVTARVNNRITPIGREAAAILAQRGIREHGNKFYWHHDSKLLSPSNVGLSYEMMEPFVDAVSAKTLVVLAKQGMTQGEKVTEHMSSHCREAIQKTQAQLKWVDGGHFIHMEKASSQVAQIVNLFLSQ